MKTPKPLKRSPLKPRKSWLPRISKKKAKEQREWEKARKECLERAGYKCQSVHGFEPGDLFLQDWATESHHLVLRKRGGSNEQSNLLAVSRICHSRIHLNPEWATEHGLMKSGWSEDRPLPKATRPDPSVSERSSGEDVLKARKTRQSEE